MSKERWIVFLLTLLAGTFLSLARCRAEAQCPWLNAATAAGVLGGEVHANITPITVQGDTTCDFNRTQQSGVVKLTIAVHTMVLPSKDFPAYLAKCAGTPAPLKGIGNEAFQCVPNSTSSHGVEQIIGRVRERAFVIDLTKSSTQQLIPNANGLSSEARNVAEQVAGALF